MTDNIDSTNPDFWNSRYASGKIPWDFGGVPASLTAFLARSPGAGTVLVPGIGTGYEIRAFHDAGYDVTGIDFSPAAIAAARTILGGLADRVLLGDFFAYDFGGRHFDLVYERTFLCSLPPVRWTDYVDRVARLLAPDGKLAGVFVYGQEPEPPPFPLSDDQAGALFGKWFHLDRTEFVTDSLPLFKGMERWQEWVKISDANRRDGDRAK